eukprot:5970211-Pyramimonas_sp.AAC.1
MAGSMALPRSATGVASTPLAAITKNRASMPWPPGDAPHPSGRVWTTDAAARPASTLPMRISEFTCPSATFISSRSTTDSAQERPWAQVEQKPTPTPSNDLFREVSTC